VRTMPRLPNSAHSRDAHDKDLVRPPPQYGAPGTEDGLRRTGT
jgi:hypothetical protein